MTVDYFLISKVAYNNNVEFDTLFNQIGLSKADILMVKAAKIWPFCFNTHFNWPNQYVVLAPNIHCIFL